MVEQVNKTINRGCEKKSPEKLTIQQRENLNKTLVEYGPALQQLSRY
jgi:hypothetical protein